MSEKMYKRAVKYSKNGWIVIPLLSPKAPKKNKDDKRPGKKPLIRAYQKLRKPLTESELKKWLLNTDNNIGLVTGKHSDVMAFDFDSYQFRDYLFDGIELTFRTFPSFSIHF